LDGAHLAILGSGGIGKTSIALAILHDSRMRAKFKADDCHFIACEALTSGAHLVDALIWALAVRVPASGQSKRLDALFLHLKQSYSVSPLLLILDTLRHFGMESHSERR